MKRKCWTLYSNPKRWCKLDVRTHPRVWAVTPCLEVEWEVAHPQWFLVFWLHFGPFTAHLIFLERGYEATETREEAS